MNLELLAPARNAQIGIAAIDCGADAVYIAGPAFGARKDAGNSIEDIEQLCQYAHRFGARIFVTYNIQVREDELELMHEQMLAAQKAGADAFIIRDLHVCQWKDITIPLHASTQCSIRDPQRAKMYEEAGCTRIIPERQLSLQQLRAISQATSCEIEVFVHGALCVGYSGQCRLSEYLSERSADRGECIQACRSLYTVTDTSGKVLLKDKAVLSLKDLQLIDRLQDLIDAGACSFKIEGRLKSISYVRNIVRAYSIALDRIVQSSGGKHSRASFGKVYGGFTPDTVKTFNRGYTTLFLDGKKHDWACMDAPKSMGEKIGAVQSIRYQKNGGMVLTVDCKGTSLCNGDGFAFVGKSGIVGFRADVCSANQIFCKRVDSLKEGTILWRNISASFEKELESAAPSRLLSVQLTTSLAEEKLTVRAITEDGRKAEVSYPVKDYPVATNQQRMRSMLEEGLNKRHSWFLFSYQSCTLSELPLLSAAQINNIRRELATTLEKLPAMNAPTTINYGFVSIGIGGNDDELMRSKYCIRRQLCLCSLNSKGVNAESLLLHNNGKVLYANFDCKECEMYITPVQK